MMMLLLRHALLATLASLLCGCAAAPALFGPSTGTVTGHVSVRACGGAYRIDQNGCRIGAADGAQITFVVAGASQNATATTDVRGAYRISLRPGTYTVQVQLHGTPSAALARSTPPGGYAGPRQVTVPAGQTITADFTYTIELL